jgi:hypothetical protein
VQVKTIADAEDVIGNPEQTKIDCSRIRSRVIYNLLIYYLPTMYKDGLC